jgi:hypothetical protein
VSYDASNRTAPRPHTPAASGERLADQHLEDDQRLLVGDRLVPAHDVRVGQPFEQPALGYKRVPGVGVVQPLGAKRLENGAGSALLAPGVVHVD